MAGHFLCLQKGPKNTDRSVKRKDANGTKVEHDLNPKVLRLKNKKQLLVHCFPFFFFFALEFQRENLKTTLFSIARLVANTDWDLGGIVPLIKGRAETFDTLVSFQIVKLHDYHYYFILLFSQNFAAFWQSTVFVDFRKKVIKTKSSWCCFAMNFLQTLRKYGKLKYCSSFINRFPLPRYCYVKEKQSVAACLAANISGRSENSVNWIQPVNRFSFWKLRPMRERSYSPLEIVMNESRFRSLSFTENIRFLLCFLPSQWWR